MAAIRPSQNGASPCRRDARNASSRENQRGKHIYSFIDRVPRHSLKLAMSDCFDGWDRINRYVLAFEPELTFGHSDVRTSTGWQPPRWRSSATSGASWHLEQFRAAIGVYHVVAVGTRRRLRFSGFN